ncbi:hypothetical protein HQ544_00960 [Candidatus Falkowbacteria bacterium]|nr:hypothetical protein [Candidatus Falkowbacteria bacterium]
MRTYFIASGDLLRHTGGAEIDSRACYLVADNEEAVYGPLVDSCGDAEIPCEVSCVLQREEPWDKTQESSFFPYAGRDLRKVRGRIRKEDDTLHWEPLHSLEGYKLLLEAAAANDLEGMKRVIAERGDWGEIDCILLLEAAREQAWDVFLALVPCVAAEELCPAIFEVVKHGNVPAFIRCLRKGFEWGMYAQTLLRRAHESGAEEIRQILWALYSVYYPRVLRDTWDIGDPPDATEMGKTLFKAGSIKIPGERLL